jgi:hypothetical protein
MEKQTMQTKSALALALVSLLTLGGTAMAAQKADYTHSRRMTHSESVYNARAQAPGAYVDQGYAFREGGHNLSDSNQPSGFGNQSLFDRAKGFIQ